MVACSVPETNRKRTDAEEDSARKLEAVTQGKEQINLNQQEVGVSIEKTKQEYESLKSNIEKASTALGKAYWLLDLVGWLAARALSALTITESLTAQISR